MAPNAAEPQNQPLESDSVEAQLVSYAQDLRRLLREEQRIRADATQAKQFGELRGRELSALNSLVQGWLAELFELEEEYESVLDRLEEVAQTTQPSEARERLQVLVREGRARLQKRREHDLAPGPSSPA